MVNYSGHLRTVNEHRKLVRKYCFRVGLYRQGLLHDLSKYTPAEFLNSARYYTGKRSPVPLEREDKGYSAAWLHHKGRNKHHPEYWTDYILEKDGGPGFGAHRMPAKYVAEMFCDSLAASHIYLGENYTDSALYDRYCREKDHKIIHPDTAEEFRKMIIVLRDEGEDAALEYVKKWLRESRHKSFR